MSKKRFIVACGGTGGHAFPGLAVAEVLSKRGHDIEVWDAGRAVEGSVMRSWEGTLFSTGAKPLSIKNIFANIVSFCKCWFRMRRFKPSALLAMGSYTSLPPVLAAKCCGVKVILHEANTIPGKAVSFLSRFAVKTAISFPETKKWLDDRETVLTGLPVREELLEAKPFVKSASNTFTVFITGGSQGAHSVNKLAVEACEILSKEIKEQTDKVLEVIHQTGIADEGWVLKHYTAAKIPSRVKSFERDMGSAFASADIIVARAGASTCFELALMGKPVLFIPLPTAMLNHQHFNAQAFVEKGAADEATQSEFTPRAMANYLLHKAKHPELLDKMSEVMKEIGLQSVKGAAERVADLLEGLDG